MERNCTIEGCTEAGILRAAGKFAGAGFCDRHEQRMTRNGRPDIPGPLERLLGKIRPEATGCWTWTGSMKEKGYGQVNVGSRPQRAHRVAYELLIGPVPEGLELDHLCRNRACVNPDHLEPVTHAENIRRGVQRRAVA